MAATRTVYLHRHGARGPSGSCFKFWSEHGIKGKNGEQHPVVSDWDPSEIDQLTLAGKRQMAAFGQYLKQRHVDMEDCDVKWYSSLSGRAFESGRIVMDQFYDGRRRVCNEPETLDDSVCRPFNVHAAYIDKVQTSLSWPQFRELAQSLETLVDRLFSVCRLRSPSPPSPAVKLMKTTYFDEIMNCEEHHISRNALTQLLKEDTVLAESVPDWARSAWNQRFFSVGRQFRQSLAQPLLRLIFEDSASARLTVLSAHDYTILSVLVGLVDDRLSYTDFPVLKFGSCLVFDFDSVERVRIRLIPEPFLGQSDQVYSFSDERAVVLTSLPTREPPTDDGWYARETVVALINDLHDD